MHISIKRLLNALSKGGVWVLITLVALGCEWGDRSITLVRPDTDNLQVVFTDTITILRSTVMKDSMYSADGNLLAGRLNDNLLGLVTANTFLAPSANSGITIPERAVYDSIALASSYVYYYGDTTKRYQVSAYQLTQDITSGPYYNQRGASYNETPVGQASLFPRPKGNDTLRIKLSDELGRTIFNEAAANRIKNQDNLLKHFKGLALVSGTANQSGFLGFSKEKTMVTLYYHVDGPEGKTKHTTDLPVGQFYNQIVNDRSGTAFESLTSSKTRLSTDQTDGVSVVQGGVGLMTRIDLPHIHQFGAELGKVVINRAFLRIQLARNPENKWLTPPPTIGLYASRALNEWEPSSSPLFTGNYVNDSIHNERYYQVDLSNRILEMAQSKTPLEFGFIIAPTSSNSVSMTNSLSRLILPKGSVKLQVYYTTLIE